MSTTKQVLNASVLIVLWGLSSVTALGVQEAGMVPSQPPPPDVRKIVAKITPSSAKGFVEKLVSFGTRQTYSDTESDTRGIGAARRWIKSEFERFATQSGRTGDDAIKVYFDSKMQEGGRRTPEPVEIVNVVMEIPGSLPEARDRRYYVIGHYDSIPNPNRDREIDAPGADDDGSGTAVTMELARVLSQYRFDSTLVFVTTAAEEQGLIGARNHAELAKENGWDVRGVLSNDIVGDPTAPDGGTYHDRIRIFSEGLPATATEQQVAAFARFGTYSDSPSRQLARFVADVAAWEKTAVQPMLVFRKDRFGRGGDHTAFNQNGFAAVRFTELFEEYTRQHQSVRVEDGVAYGDLPEFVDAEYLANVARLNGSVLVHMANAPSSPKGVRVSGRTANATISWEVSPEADVAGYEVVYRLTTSPFWEQAVDAGSETRLRVDVSRDNHYFGVRAYDKDGYRSPVSFSSLERQRRGRRGRRGGGGDGGGLENAPPITRTSGGGY